jgi:hypothetical protein
LKTNTVRVFSVVGFVAATLIICGVTNGFVNLASAKLRGSLNYQAQLSGSKELPPVSTAATGLAKFQVSANGQTLDYQITVTNINAVTGAHIHIGKQRQNGPVVAGLFNPNMSGPPTGKVNGLLAKGAIKSADLEGPLTGHPLTDLVHLINGHGAYVNIHTQQNPDGEIRGQIG